MSSMYKRLQLFLTLSWLFLLQACGQTNSAAYDLMLQGLYKDTVPQITPEDLNKLLLEDSPAVLLDTRSKAEYSVSHLSGARLITPASFDPEALKLQSKEVQIIVYCSVGYRSERVGEKLLGAGYTNVQNLYGGIFKWVNSGLPVVNAHGKTKQVHAYSRSWGVWLQKGEKVYGE